MKKYILLVALLAVGIFGVIQSTSAFNPGGIPVGAEAEKSVDAKVVIHKDKDGRPIGFKIDGVDPQLVDGILENAFDFMDDKGAVYILEEKDLY